jgi:hypothetical protein
MSVRESCEKQAEVQRKRKEENLKKIEALLSTEEGRDKFFKAIANQMAEDSVYDYSSPLNKIARDLLKG